ncbi:MAG: metal-dependent hydrolase [Epsilonproteobacteria bacterium]|nr:MAG: metal-dependent hydrolase [Campylobacterota bacterium]
MSIVKASLTKNATYTSIYGLSGNKTIYEILKWKLSKNPQREVKQKENYKLKVIKSDKVLDIKDDFIYWLGHATFLLQIDGKKILTDPCLFAPPMMKRLTPLPIDTDKIKPDYILVSHGHYDHLDKKSIRYFDGITVLVPLNMTKLVKSMNSTINTIEANWYEKYDIKESFSIEFLPAFHWHKRTISDANKILWGSFLIKTKTKTIYFGGDSGYNKHFKDIGKYTKNIDISILTIGAYKPRDFMKLQHINPHEAIKANDDLNSKLLIPMHYGTFDLSDEPLGEPEQLLRSYTKTTNIKFLDIGEIYLI